MTKSQHSAAWEAGQQARLQRLPASVNPFRVGSWERWDWILGYDTNPYAIDDDEIVPVMGISGDFRIEEST